jgi:hypothetical protein
VHARDGRPKVDRSCPTIPAHRGQRAWGKAESSAMCNLITTRCGDYQELGGVLDLRTLEREDAVDLLCSFRTPVSGTEKDLAAQICTDLGRHALAIAVGGGRLAASTARDPLVTSHRGGHVHSHGAGATTGSSCRGGRTRFHPMGFRRKLRAVRFVVKLFAALVPFLVVWTLVAYGLPATAPHYSRDQSDPFFMENGSWR